MTPQTPLTFHTSQDNLLVNSYLDAQFIIVAERILLYASRVIEWVLRPSVVVVQACSELYNPLLFGQRLGY